MKFSYYVSKSGKIHKDKAFGPDDVTKCGGKLFEFWDEIEPDSDQLGLKTTSREKLVRVADEEDLDFCEVCFPHHPDNAKVHLPPLSDEEAEVLETGLVDADEDLRLREKIREARERCHRRTSKWEGEGIADA